MLWTHSSSVAKSLILISCFAIHLWPTWPCILRQVAYRSFVRLASFGGLTRNFRCRFRLCGLQAFERQCNFIAGHITLIRYHECSCILSRACFCLQNRSHVFDSLREDQRNMDGTVSLFQPHTTKGQFNVYPCLITDLSWLTNCNTMSWKSSESWVIRFLCWSYELQASNTQQSQQFLSRVLGLLYDSALGPVFVFVVLFYLIIIDLKTRSMSILHVIFRLYVIEHADKLILHQVTFQARSTRSKLSWFVAAHKSFIDNSIIGSDCCAVNDPLLQHCFEINSHWALQTVCFLRWNIWDEFTSDCILFHESYLHLTLHLKLANRLDQLHFAILTS